MLRRKYFDFVEKIKGSPESVQKTVFAVLVFVVTVLVFAGWMFSFKIFYSVSDATKKTFEESDTILSGSDIYSIADVLLDRLESKEEKYSTPPVYFTLKSIQ